MGAGPGRRRWRPRRTATAALLSFAVWLGLDPAAARAWSSDGHRLVARLSVERLSAMLPAFMLAGVDRIATAALDPDVVRLKALPALRAGEAPEHFLDSELLAGMTLPEDRYRYLAGLAARDLQAPRVGTLPYAIVEGTQRLTVALAEYRLQPENAAIREKVLYRAGVLAHYAADLCQPLHTTVHFDGRARPDGSSPQSGIHRRVDGLFRHLTAGDADGASVPSVDSDLLGFVMANFARSHSLVNRVYELERLLDAETGSVAPALRTLAVDRLRHSVEFTAALMAAAWKASGELELPAWRRGRAQPISE